MITFKSEFDFLKLTSVTGIGLIYFINYLYVFILYIVIL